MAEAALDPPASTPGALRQTIVSITAVTAAVAAVLPGTIINVAIPDIMGSFGIGQIEAQWLATGFFAAMTATMLLTDWVVKVFGQRMGLALAMAIFVAGAILGGISPDADLLVLSRVLQGAAAGVVMPLSMLIMFEAFPPSARGLAMGLFGVGVVLAPAIGPLVGGILIDALGWRYVFYMGVPVASLAILLALMVLPGRQEKGPPPGFDWIGFALLAAFLVALLTGLSNGQIDGWSSEASFWRFAAALAAGIAFVFWERHVEKPMLDLRLFANTAFSAASVVAFIFGAGLFGSTYLIPIFAQTVQGMSATTAGLLMLPAGVAMAAVFPFGGRLADLVSPGWLCVFGTIVFAWSCWLTAQVDIGTDFWTFAIWILIGRMSLGVLFPALSVAALAVLPPHLMAQGSGASNFVRQLGGAFGVNLLAIMLERRSAYHADALALTQHPGNPATMDWIGRGMEMAARAGLGEPQHLPLAIYQLGRTVWLQAYMLGFRDGFLITTAAFVISLLPCLWLVRTLALQRR
ncbi:DHA2 family efflux MFS transporter permease subunit [Marinibaculum pumilum]|uniref:DHA2 family efflux MFS transporter permease subunit n=1 Tax=Marinibaculum pumilum TaxID=1766165 RepID=A0ABV7KXV1_9PROT